MSEEKVHIDSNSRASCRICGKILATPNVSATFDYTRFCTGFHPLDTGAFTANTVAPVHLSPLDLRNIRTIVREEFLHIIEEQELKLEEIFKQPMEKHDGKLGGNATVSIRDQFHDVAIMHFSGMSILGPKQALSLLAWFRQEESTLEKMAREQQTNEL